MAAARARRIDYWLVWRWDRFARDTAEATTRVRELRGLGVRVLSATEGDSNLLRNLSFVLAEEESERISVRVKAAMAHLVKSGRHIAAAPFGYRWESAPDGSRHLAVVPDEAELYRRMAARYIAGESVRSICAWARAQVDGEGHPFRTARGYPITPVYLGRALVNPIYAGTIRWNRRQKSKVYGNRALPEAEHVRVPDAAPAIVSAETHAAILAEYGRRARASSGQARATAFALTGLLRCACGARMYGHRSATAHSSAGVFYYRCDTKVAGLDCALPNLRGLAYEWEIAAAILDPAVLGRVTSAELERRHAARADRAGGELRRESLRRDIARQRERIGAATTLLIDGVIGREEYARQVAAFEGALRGAERELSTIARAPAFDARAVLAAIPRAPVGLESLTTPERRRLFRAFVLGATWDGATLAVEWTPAAQLIIEEAGREFAAPPIRKRGGYAAWGRMTGNP